MLDEFGKQIDDIADISTLQIYFTVVQIKEYDNFFDFTIVYLAFFGETFKGKHILHFVVAMDWWWHWARLRPQLKQLQHRLNLRHNVQMACNWHKSNWTCCMTNQKSWRQMQCVPFMGMTHKMIDDFVNFMIQRPVLAGKATHANLNTVPNWKVRALIRESKFVFCKNV